MRNPHTFFKLANGGVAVTAIWAVCGALLFGLTDNVFRVVLILVAITSLFYCWAATLLLISEWRGRQRSEGLTAIGAAAFGYGICIIGTVAMAVMCAKLLLNSWL